MSNDIEFVGKKADNTPDCPQIIPFEIFWQFFANYYPLMPTFCDWIKNMRKNGSRIAKQGLVQDYSQRL